jgi:hypothetical protein
MKLTTTLNRIRACSPCTDGWKTLLTHMGPNHDPDAPINLLTVLESNGVQDMLWCLRATEQDSKPVAVELAVLFAESVLPIFEAKFPDDDRPRKAIEAAQAYLRGEDAACAACAADAADAADAARAAYAAARAAYAAAYAADAARAAAYAARAAYAAADAARAADASIDQASIIRSVLTDTDAKE